jgi:hypothetical protein
LTIGGSTLGYSRTPRKLIPIIPNTIIVMLITIASTGRLMLIEDKLAIIFSS